MKEVKTMERQALETVLSIIEEMKLGSNEIARRTGLSSSLVSGMIRGEHAPSIRTIDRLAEAFGFRVHVSWERIVS